MKNKSLTKIIASLGIFGATTVFAGEKVEVKVKGMVCSFCAQGIKKKFLSTDAVSKVDVHFDDNPDDKVDDNWVRLELADNETLNNEQIDSLVKSAGYNVVSIDRTGKAPASTDKK